MNSVSLICIYIYISQKSLAFSASYHNSAFQKPGMHSDLALGTPHAFRVRRVLGCISKVVSLCEGYPNMAQYSPQMSLLAAFLPRVRALAALRLDQ